MKPREFFLQDQRLQVAKRMIREIVTDRLIYVAYGGLFIQLGRSYFWQEPPLFSVAKNKNFTMAPMEIGELLGIYVT